MGELGLSVCLNVLIIRASPCCDSPSDVIQIVWSFGLVVWIPSSVVLTSANMQKTFWYLYKVAQALKVYKVKK